MQFYSIFRSILHQPPPGKWIPLIQTAEGGSINSYFFTGVQCHLLHVLLINVAIISDSALFENLVLIREVQDTFISTHHSLQTTAVIYSHKEADKLYLLQGPYYLPHPSTKTINNKFHNEYIMCYLSGIYHPPLATLTYHLFNTQHVQKEMIDSVLNGYIIVRKGIFWTIGEHLYIFMIILYPIKG